MHSRLRFDITLDDLIAFQEYHFAHSPSLKKRIQAVRWGGALVLFLASFIGYGGPHWTLINLPFILAFAVALGTPAYMRSAIRRTSATQLKEGSLKQMVGPFLLEVHPDGIFEQNDLHDLKTRWQGVERIVSSKTHTFVYTSPVQAHIIPHDRITEGNLKEFVQDAEQHMAFAARLPA